MSDVRMEVRDSEETYVVSSDVGYKYLNGRVTALEGSLEKDLADKWAKALQEINNYFNNLQVNIVGNKIVDELPEVGDPGILYLVMNEAGTAYTSYIYANDKWVKLAVIDFSKYVPITRKVNEKALDTDIVLTATDIGGDRTKAMGENSHAEGTQCEALGDSSHAEGIQTKASGLWSHVEGSQTRANGPGSHAEGTGSWATGPSSHAEGYGTEAAGKYQHVQGKHNVIDEANKFADIVGNGADILNKSNAYALDWDGNLYLKGGVYVNCNADSTGGTKLSLDVDSIMGAIKDQLYEKVYPVGSVYMTSDDNFNPEEVFGGTWHHVTDDVYLKAVMSGGGSRGGSTDHVITASNLPPHVHGMRHTHNVSSKGYYAIATQKVWRFETFGGKFTDNSAKYKVPMVHTATSSSPSGEQRDCKTTGSASITDTGTGSFENTAYHPGYYGVHIWERKA
nr:MAG TPA: baseplate protein [Caudoviricetes sp.]